MPNVPMSTRTSSVRSAEAGFSLLELMLVVGIAGVLMAVAVMVMPVALKSARADSGVAQLIATLRVAREQAIAERRNVQVDFIAPNRITVSRIEVPGPGTTVVADTWLEGGNAYMQFPGVPDTPDAFGSGNPVSFNGAASVAFTSSGEFVNEDGDPVNGTVFVGAGNDPVSARAVSIFGPTALVREWRWNGTHWTN